jgi:hypothetical protein
MFAKSAYKWNLGSRKKAFNLCEQAIYSMLIGNIKDTEYIISDINQLISYDKWKNCIIDILIEYPNLNILIRDWIEQFKGILKKRLDIYQLVPKKDKKINNIVKIKSRDNKFKDFKNKSIKIFFEKKNYTTYTRSSVHGVKGETYEALLLYIQSLKKY